MTSQTVTDGDLALDASQAFRGSSGGKIWIDRKKMLRQARGYWYVRRGQDIVLSLAALIVLCIPMMIVALIIWIDSPGASPFFTQKRVGRNGKTFDFIKFRSMVPNADQMLDSLLEKNEMDGPVFKIKNDPRITRVGKFIPDIGQIHEIQTSRSNVNKIL